MRYYNGQPVRVSTVVTDASGTVGNPSTLALSVLKPDGTTQNYPSPVNDSAGRYHQDLPAADLPLNGRYAYRWTATGTNAGVAVGSFDVSDPFAGSMLTLDDAKQQLNISSANITYDVELQAFVDAVVDLIERYTGPWANRTVTELARGGESLVLNRPPVVSITSVADPSGVQTVDVSTTFVNAESGVVRFKQGQFSIFPPTIGFPDPCTVTYVAGRGVGASVPASVQLAARITVEHLWTTQRGSGTAGGGDNYTDSDQLSPGYGFALPNRALALLAAYRVAPGIG